MKNKTLLAYILCLLALPLTAGENVLPQPQTQQGFVYFSADEADADPTAKKVHLKGNVTLVQQTKEGEIRTAKGEDITLDQINTTITSVGPMTLQGMGATLSADNVSVNYKTKDFHAENIQTQYPPLRVISAKEISVQDGTERLKGAVLTCCDNPDPHYTISLGNLKVSPEKKIFGTNAVFKLDGFPVMWLPVFWRSLAPCSSRCGSRKCAEKTVSTSILPVRIVRRSVVCLADGGKLSSLAPNAAERFTEKVKEMQAGLAFSAQICYSTWARIETGEGDYL